jgi:hypothetical protein
MRCKTYSNLIRATVFCKYRRISEAQRVSASVCGVSRQTSGTPMGKTEVV